MSEMDQILAMIRGQQGGMGGNNLGAMPSMGPRPMPQSGYGMPSMPPMQGGGNQLGSQFGGGGNVLPQFLQPGGGPRNPDGSPHTGDEAWFGPGVGGDGGVNRFPGGPQGGGQMGMGMLGQLLSSMFGRGQGMGQSGGMGLQNGMGGGFGNGGGNSGAMSSMPGRVYAGGNPNFNENGGYMAAGTKPMMPPTIPGGYPGPTPQFQPKPFGIPPGIPGGTPGPTRNGGGMSLARLGLRTPY